MITYLWKEVYPWCASLTLGLTPWHETLHSFRESYTRLQLISRLTLGWFEPVLFLRAKRWAPTCQGTGVKSSTWTAHRGPLRKCNLYCVKYDDWNTDQRRWSIEVFSLEETPREGVIIEWPPNKHFHDVVIDILTSRTGVREMVDHDHDHEPTLGVIFRELKTS